MNRKGFTLMELLLVVAVLAIVAAAAAPTFFGGAKDAMNEARKSSFMSAYQNTISGANMLVAVAASQGKTIAAGELKFTDSSSGTEKKLADYVPVAARQFNIIDDTTTRAFTATMGANNTVVVSYGEADGSNEPKNPTPITVTTTVDAALTAAWKVLNPSLTAQ
jgi:prepilin-type N-terminal cleavage/methylation domain-containing protein